VRGVELLQLGLNSDHRGDLLAFEIPDGLPFAAKRVFTILSHEGKYARGGHANSCDELIICLGGSVKVILDNGSQKKSIDLLSPTQALWVKPGVFLRLDRFSPHTVLMVFASLSYEETQHFDCPQPDFFLMDCH